MSDTETLNLEELSRGDVKRLLELCGGPIWKDFRKRRNMLERTGMTAQEAHKTACEEYRFSIETGSQVETSQAVESGIGNVTNSNSNSNSISRGTGSEEGSAASEFDRIVKFGFAYAGLCSKDDFTDKPFCPTTKAIDWVAENMGYVDVTPDDCPAGMAWHLLCWCRASIGNMTEFWARIATKRIPSRTLIDDGRSYADDGREELTQIDRILRLASNEDPAAQKADLEDTVERLDLDTVISIAAEPDNQRNEDYAP
jgi:hypothetical protein